MSTRYNLVLREASTDDAKSIARILRSIGDFSHIDNEPEESTEKRIASRSMRSQPSHDQIFVAVLGE